MKKFMKSLVLVAVAAMGFTSCSNNFEDVTTSTETFSLTIESEKPALESDSRTEFNDGSIIWTENDQIRACYYHSTGVWSNYYASTQNAITDGGAKATFTGINTSNGGFPAISGEGTYTFYAGYPKAAIGGGKTNAPTAGELSVEVPTEQTMPKLGTFDPNADVMVGVSPEVVDAPATTISVVWTRLVAHGCVTLKNLAAEAGEKVLSVTFTAPEGVNLTGIGEVNFTEQTMTALNNNTVTVALPANTEAKVAELPVWFCSAPATIASGANFTVAVETTRGTYTRTITANANGIKFLQNRYNTLGINMASAEFTPAVVSSDVWAKVTSLDEITDGTYVIVANNYYCPNNVTEKPQAYTLTSANVSVDGNVLSGNVPDKMKWTFTGTASGMVITKFAGSEQLYATNTNNGIKVGSSDGKNWVASGSNGEFMLVYQLDEPRCLTLYNSADWRCYKTSTAAQSEQVRTLTLYKLQNSDAPAEPRLSLAQTEIEVEAAGGQTTVGVNAANLPAALTAVADVDWITNVTVSETALTFAVDENDDEEERTAKIVVASGDLSVTLNITQKGINTEPVPGTGEGTEASPYDVTRAYAVIDAANGGTVSGVYVKGIITEDAISFSSQYGNSDYYISNDGTTTNKLQVFRGKYLNNEAFTSADQIHAGDEVVIYGNLKKYYETYEFDSGNHIVSLNCPHGENSTEQTITFDYKPATVTVGKTATVVATAKTTVTYSSSNIAVATVDANTGVITGVAEGIVTITATAAAEGIYKQATATFELTVEAAQEGGTVTLGESYTYEFSSKVFSTLGETKALGSLNWTVNGTGSTYFGNMDSNNGRGLQFGSKSSPFTALSLTTTEYQGGVQTIKINTSGASGIAAKFTVTVGGVVIGSTQSLTTSAKEYTLTSTEMLSGDIVISYTATTGKAIYIKSISIN